MGYIYPFSWECMKMPFLLPQLVQDILVLLVIEENDLKGYKQREKQEYKTSRCRVGLGGW